MTASRTLVPSAQLLNLRKHAVRGALRLGVHHYTSKMEAREHACVGEGVVRRGCCAGVEKRCAVAQQDTFHRTLNLAKPLGRLEFTQVPRKFVANKVPKRSEVSQGQGMRILTCRCNHWRLAQAQVHRGQGTSRPGTSRTK